MLSGDLGLCHIPAVYLGLLALPSGQCRGPGVLPGWDPEHPAYSHTHQGWPWGGASPGAWPSLSLLCCPGLAVGLDPQGYGNPDFCWLSLRDTLIWSFAGPIGIVIIVSTGAGGLRTQDPRGYGNQCPQSIGWRACSGWLGHRLLQAASRAGRADPAMIRPLPQTLRFWISVPTHAHCETAQCPAPGKVPCRQMARGARGLLIPASPP